MIVKSILFISFPQVLYGTVHHSFHFTRHFLKRYVQTTPVVNSSTDCRADCREERRDSAEVRWSSSSEAWRARLTSWLSVQAAGRRLDVNSVGNGCKMLINAVYTPLTPIHLVSPIHILYTKPWSLQRGTGYLSLLYPSLLQVTFSSASSTRLFGFDGVDLSCGCTGCPISCRIGVRYWGCLRSISL